MRVEPYPEHARQWGARDAGGYTLAQAPETCGAGDPLWIRAHYAAGEIVPPTTIIRARCESN